MNLHHGDCLEVLRTLPDASVDSLVTDPPAGIAFMGKDWDKDKGGRDAWVAWMRDVMAECLRVLKPGAHALVWAIPRTSHWTATALEDAGFEIRDVVTHLFGTGFPKSLDISKAIDKAAGAEREVIDSVTKSVGDHHYDNGAKMGRFGSHAGVYSKAEIAITAPATPEAQQWQGWGTALKPASEHWILARKPISEKNVAANVLKWGTGGINVDGCRIEGEADRPTGLKKDGSRSQKVGNEGWDRPWKNDERANRVVGDGARSTNLGRFPANLVLSHSDGCKLVGTKKVKPSNGSGKAGGGANGFRSEYVGGEKDGDGFTGGYVAEDGTETVEAWECEPGCAVRMLDEQSGTLVSGAGGVRRKPHSGSERIGQLATQPIGERAELSYADSGGASRFFYCAKASRKDRNSGAKIRGE